MPLDQNNAENVCTENENWCHFLNYIYIKNKDHETEKSMG